MVLRWHCRQGNRLAICIRAKPSALGGIFPFFVLKFRHSNRNSDYSAFSAVYLGKNQLRHNCITVQWPITMVALSNAPTEHIVERMLAHAQSDYVDIMAVFLNSKLCLTQGAHWS